MKKQVSKTVYKIRLKKGDTVVVRSGKYKGQDRQSHRHAPDAKTK